MQEEDSFEDSLDSNYSPNRKSCVEDSPVSKKGSLMVLNFDLGKIGSKQLRCLSSDNCCALASQFSREHKLGPKTKQKIEKLILEKQK